MFCPHCGSSVTDNARFCPECGAVLDSSSSATAPSPAPASEPSWNASAQPPHPQPQPQYQTPATTLPGALRTDRDIITYALLTFVTCGIYGYWYIYRMALDANVICADDGDETPGLAVYILLSIVTCGIYSLYWQYKLANRLQANAPRYGLQIQEGGSDVLIWLVLGTLVCIICQFIGTNIILKNLNTLCEAYNRQNGLG